MSAGRAGPALKAAAMRLGLRVFMVGKMAIPAIKAGDLLLAGSGSGTTQVVVLPAAQEQDHGGTISQ